MRNISLLYRMLLPPIFLFRFCLPRPPEWSPGHQTTAQIIDWNLGAHNFINDTDSRMSVHDKNGKDSILKMGTIYLHKMSKKRRLSKRRLHNYKKRQLRFIALANSWHNVQNYLHSDGIKNVVKFPHSDPNLRQTDYVNNFTSAQRYFNYLKTDSVSNFVKLKRSKPNRLHNGGVNEFINVTLSDTNHHRHIIVNNLVRAHINQNHLQKDSANNGVNLIQNVPNHLLTNSRVKSYDTNKHIVRFSTNADLISDQRTNGQGQKHIQTTHTRHKTFPQNLPVETNNIAAPRQGKHSLLRTVYTFRQAPKKHLNPDSKRRRKRQTANKTLSTRFKSVSPRITPPEYMVHLFQLLTGTRYETLRNFVVTGFLNVHNNEDSVDTSDDMTSHTHTLAFQVLLSHETETIHYAELRLYLFRKSSQTLTPLVYETAGHLQEQSYTISIFEKYQKENSKRRQISTQTVTNPDRTWLSFNVTSAAQDWPPESLQVLEVTIAGCRNCTDDDSSFNVSHNSTVNSFDYLALNLDNDKGPLLVIFSKKHESPVNVPHRRDVRAAKTRHNESNKQRSKSSQLRQNDVGYKDNENVTSVEYFTGLAEFMSMMSSDIGSNELDLIKNTLLNADTVQNNTAEENRELIYNAYNSTNLNAKDNHQSTAKNSRQQYRELTISDGGAIQVNNSRLHKRSDWRINATGPVNIHRSVRQQFSSLRERRTFSVDKKNVKMPHDVYHMRLRRETKTRYRRHLESLLKHDAIFPVGVRQKRSKKKRTSCQRNEMYVDFETIKWEKVIIFPRGYQAFVCAGRCYTPISEYLTPTKHAIIQTLVHTSYPEQASRACCVPTKLDPISILYWDETGDIKFDYTYEGMVVAECGCR